MSTRFWQIAVRLLAPIAAAFALVSVLTPQTDLDSDLVLVAPDRIDATKLVPIRALAYTGLNATEGPRLIATQARVELHSLDAASQPGSNPGSTGKLLASAALSVGHGPTLEGELRIPDDVYKSGSPMTLVAHAQIDGSHLTVERKLEQRPAASAAPNAAPNAVPNAVPPTPRSSRALQRLAVAPIRALTAEPVPSALQPRIAGGSCVPEQPCEVLVHVGEPAAELTLELTPSVTLESRSPESATANVVLLRIRAYGPEAEMRLIAKRDGVAIAKRSVRLPIALGADAMQLEPSVVRLSQKPNATLLGADPTGIVDVFANGAWALTQSIGLANANEPLPIDLPQRTGLFRVQLRRDPFESQSAAVRTIYVRDPEQSDALVLKTLAQAALEIDPNDALARSLLSDSGPSEPRAPAADMSAADDTDERDPRELLASVPFDLTSRYLLAVLDDGVYELPAKASGFPLAQARARAQRSEVRKLALIVIALAAASLVLLLVQRGLRGSEEATRVLRASGVGHENLARDKLGMTLRLVAVAVSVLLAFFAIALYLIARG